MVLGPTALWGPITYIITFECLVIYIFEPTNGVESSSFESIKIMDHKIYIIRVSLQVCVFVAIMTTAQLYFKSTLTNFICDFSRSDKMWNW